MNAWQRFTDRLPAFGMCLGRKSLTFFRKPKSAEKRLRGADPNGGVNVVGLGTNHRLSLAQNPVLLAGQIAILSPPATAMYPDFASGVR